MFMLIFLLALTCLPGAGCAQRVRTTSKPFLSGPADKSQALATLLLARKPAAAFTIHAASALRVSSATAPQLERSAPRAPPHSTANTRYRVIAPRAEEQQVDFWENLKFQLSNKDTEARPVSALFESPAGVAFFIVLALLIFALGALVISEEQKKAQRKQARKEEEMLIRQMSQQEGFERQARIIKKDQKARKKAAARAKAEKEAAKKRMPWQKKPEPLPDLDDDDENKGNRYERRYKKSSAKKKLDKKLGRSGDPEMSLSLTDDEDPPQILTPRQNRPLVAMSGLLSAFSAPSSFSVGPNTNVEPLGFGTWQWGNKLLWGYDPAGDTELQRAFDTVVTPSSPFDSRRFFFDTGDSYGTGKLEGRGEELLGRFRRESAAPDRAVLGTKLAVYPWRLTGASFEDACRKSLERMGRTEVEIAQAHWSARNLQPWQEPALWDGLARCYESGLCRAVGTSNFGPDQLAKVNAYWRDRGVPHAVNQVQLSLLSQLPVESGLIDACKELGVTPIGYSPLSLGVLSGKYSEDNLPAGPRGLIFKALLPSTKPLLDTIGAIAKERNVPFSAVPINWSMCKGALVIVGMKTPEQVRENLQACGWRLDDSEIAALESAAKKAKKATQNIFQTA